MDENQDTQEPVDDHPREDDRNVEVDQSPVPDPETGSTPEEDEAAV